MSNSVLLSSVNLIRGIVSKIKPFDPLEQNHIEQTLAWINSGAPLFRTQKPDVPPKHLVSYFVLLDESALKILLVDHKKAQLWLPPGGHVEVDEDPLETVKRECFEELKIHADFWRHDPVFLTSTATVGLTSGHNDVSLWYVLKGNQGQSYDFDCSEFNAVQWFCFGDIPYKKFDPHMQRFIHKLQTML